MKKSIPGSWLIGAGVVVAGALLLTGSAGTLAYVLYGFAGLLILLGVINLRKKQ